jgi:hypothetical protein
MIDQQAQEQETKRQELQSIEQNLLSLRANGGGMLGTDSSLSRNAPASSG